MSARVQPPITNHQSPSFFLIAGEASGDAHAADLIRAIKAKAPDVQCFGAGGPMMKAAGMELLIDLTEHAVVGLVEVLQNYFKFRRFFDQLLEVVNQRRPDAVVLIDSPAFNLRFAKALDRRYRGESYRPRVIYYISPQVWAWADRRVKLIKRCVDLVLSIFPFEKQWYAERAPELRVEFVGHPMTSRFAGKQSEIKNQKSEMLLALLPGSREREIRAHWPILRAAVRQIRQSAQVQVAVLAASDRSQKMLEEIGTDGIPVVRDGSDLLSRASVSITASGTATLECAFFGVPTVVLYKVAWPTYLVGRMLVKVKHLAMPNVLAGTTIFPEFIQHDATPEAIAHETLDLLKNEARREAMQTKLAKIIASLGAPGASERAADLILAELATPRAR